MRSARLLRVLAAPKPRGVAASNVTFDTILQACKPCALTRFWSLGWYAVASAAMHSTLKERGSNVQMWTVQQIVIHPEKPFVLLTKFDTVQGCLQDPSLHAKLITSFCRS